MALPLRFQAWFTEAIRRRKYDKVARSLECPKRCGGLVHVIEDCVLRRGAIDVQEDGTVECDGYYIVWDEDSKNERLFCSDCCEEFPLPEGLDIVWL